MFVKRLTAYRFVVATALVTVVSTVPQQANAQSPQAATRSQSDKTVQTGSPTSELTTPSIDVLGEWIENNGASYNIFLDPKPAVPATTARPIKTDGLPPSVINTSDSFAEQSKKKKFTPPREAMEATHAAAQIKAVMTDLKFGNSCDQFATEKGFGVWGRTVVEEISNGKAPALVSGTSDLRRACPNYDYLNYSEKSYVWVKVLASMSFLESSCNPSANAPGIRPGRRAVGLLQLHGGSEQNYAEDCRRGASRSPRETLRCGIQMLNDQVIRSGALFSRDSYWGVLRPQGDLVKTKKGKRRAQLARIVVGSLKELPLCQRK